jgi:hypothetical protein
MPINLVESSVIAGRFRLNKMIGRGGMGSVWQATHLGLDIPCAVKFMEGEFSKSAEAHARFEREAKAAAQLRSPHVVQVLDHGVCDGTPYIAMELLDGEDLGKRLAKNGKIHPRDLNVVITQVCRALTKAHAVGIVHRDLKPDNIFLVHDDDREIAKVLDFGIAKSSAATLEGSNTKTGAMLGTPYYMSPEQAQGVKGVDYRSDLWSLGVIVYQCVTGVLPFESEALGDLLMKIMVQPLPVPSQFGEVPHGFDAWWARAASRDPAGRFQSAKEFAESLQMVFGASQATDVMDRAQLGGALGRTPNPSAQHPMMLTPAGAVTNPASGGTNPMMMTPAGHQAGGVNVTTGAPIARTFDGQGDPPLPVKKNGMAIAMSAGGLVVVAAIVGVLALRKGPTPSGPAAAGLVTTAVVTPETPPPPTAPPAPAAQTAAPAASATPQPVVSVAAPTPTPAPAVAEDAPRSSSHHSSSKGHDAPPPAAKAAAPTAKPAAAKPSDLGF